MEQEIDILGMLDERTRGVINLEALASGQRLPLRPSSAGLCGHRLAYEMVNHLGTAPDGYRAVAQPISPSTRRIFQLGHSVEDISIRDFEMLAPQVRVSHRQQEVVLGTLTSTINPEIKKTIKGSIDFILSCGELKLVGDTKSKGANKYSWEATTKKLKSMKSVKVISDLTFWIEDIQAFIEEMNDPFMAGNIMQVNSYCRSEVIKSMGIEVGSLFYYCKTTSAYREIRFRSSEELFQKTMKKFQLALDAGVSGDASMAPKDWKRGDVSCLFCPWQLTCWPDDQVSETKKEEIK